MAYELKLGEVACARCGRPLKNPKTIAIGMGKVCQRKNAAELAEMELAATMPLPFEGPGLKGDEPIDAEKYIEPFPKLEGRVTSPPEVWL